MFVSRRQLATSDQPLARALRKLRREILDFTLPLPKIILRPMLFAFLILRFISLFFMRVLVCEPLFKAYCKQYGRRVRTGEFIHFIMGKGEIILGDDVVVDGKCNFAFAARFSDHPTLIVGSHTMIGHQCTFTIGKQISIGRHCFIANGVFLFDSPGHPTDSQDRLAGLPLAADMVRPITICDNVWIGRDAIIFPGVTIGEGSVISAGSVVMTDVAPYALVAGNPARKIGSLQSQPNEQKDA